MFEAQTGHWPCYQAAGIEWEDERRNESLFAGVKRILIDLNLLLKVLDIHESIQQSVWCSDTVKWTEKNKVELYVFGWKNKWMDVALLMHKVNRFDG